MGDDLYVREHTSLRRGRLRLSEVSPTGLRLRLCPQHFQNRLRLHIHRVAREDRWRRSTSGSNCPARPQNRLDLDYACVWASPSQWCDGPEIPADHYILNMTAGGGIRGRNGHNGIRPAIRPPIPPRGGAVHREWHPPALCQGSIGFRAPGHGRQGRVPSFHRISSHALVSYDSVSEEFLTFLPEEDYDDDDDGVLDTSDACQAGELGWTSASANDHDSDGCRDESEDDDDDNDGVADLSDLCQTGSRIGPLTRPLTDDSDGCGTRRGRRRRQRRGR